jgi:hypothetical protein
VNYLNYDSIDEAERNGPIYLIPSKFTVTNADNEITEIKIGNDENESVNIGESATQNAKAHVIRDDKGLTIRIIDTAGIGDTRGKLIKTLLIISNLFFHLHKIGIEKDKENFDNLIKYISKYEYLNAICILLKPNNARLGIAFKYYLKELLSNLHKNAKDNIIFCFTNSRSIIFVNKSVIIDNHYFYVN